MKAYSVDLRARVVAAMGRGQPLARVAEQFQVSIPTISRWLRRWRISGDLAPSPRPGPPAVNLAALRAQLLPHLEAQPDATLAEHYRTVAERHGLTVSTTTMSRAITEILGWTRKKVAERLGAGRVQARRLARGGRTGRSGPVDLRR